MSLDHAPTRRDVRESMQQGGAVFVVFPPAARLTLRPLRDACRRCARWTRNGGDCCGQRPTAGVNGSPVDVGLPDCYMFTDGSMPRPIVHDADGPRLLAGQDRYWRLIVADDGAAHADPVVPSEAWGYWQSQWPPTTPETKTQESTNGR